MKHMHLKDKNSYKKIKLIAILFIFVLSTFFTFNYLNKNIYDYNTKEYINFFTESSFSFHNNMNFIINKLFDFYDYIINMEVNKR